MEQSLHDLTGIAECAIPVKSWRDQNTYVAGSISTTNIKKFCHQLGGW